MKSISTSTVIVFGSLISSGFAFSTRPALAFGVSRPGDAKTSSSSSSSSSSVRADSSLFARRGGGRQYRQQAIKIPKPPMNDEIDPIELRVTIPNPPGKDEPLGIMHRDEALAKAKELGGLDVILVNSNSDPPVVKIVDYSKYRYQQERKAKEVKKNSKATEIKEVKMSYKIDVHDYDVRKKNALKFLKQGNRVKCTVMFRGREVQHDKLGFDLLDKLAAELDETCVREGRAKREGRNLSLIISPRPEVLKKVNEDRRADEKAKKKLKEERKEKKAAAASTGTSTATEAVSTMEPILAEKTDEEIDLESDIESSLDDLFGSDGISDDLFN